MKKIKVAINGLGRIGRAFLRVVQKSNSDPERGSILDIIAVNDLMSLESAEYLMRHDSVYSVRDRQIFPADSFYQKATGRGGVLEGIRYLSEQDPVKLPWKAFGVDVVVEATGVFETYAQAKAHLEAGAKRVVLTAPAKDEPHEAGVAGATVLMGVNEEALRTCRISSNGSCTTNAGSPLLAILDAGVGIERALLNTIHGYTATQQLVDAPALGDFRRGRAGAINIVPSSTGAAIAVTKALNAFAGRFDGIAVRVPVPSGSLADITFIAKRDTSVEEVNRLLRAAAEEKRWEGIFAVTDEPVVSSDILGTPYASIADLSFTRVIGNLVKVLAWYDNEVGYAHTLLRHVLAAGKHA